MLKTFRFQKNLKAPIVWLFWFGGPLTQNREDSVRAWKKLNLDVRVLGEEDLERLEKTSLLHLPSAFRFLSANHKSDYLRSQFMWRYGGLYSDIKPPPKLIEAALWRLNSSETTFAGYREIGIHGVPKVCPPHVRKNWRRLAGNGHFYFRAGSKFAFQWMNRVEQIINEKSGLLQNPRHLNLGRYPVSESEKIDSYPLRWAELQGEVFHSLQAEWNYPARLCLPRPILKDYL